MSGLEAEVVRVGQFALSAIIVKLKTYMNYVKNCEQNLGLLVDNLESLRVEKDDIDEKVLSGKEKLEKVTAKAGRWLARVKEFTRDESMKKLMFKDIEIAKVMLKLIKDDLKKFIEDDVGMRDLVVKVMKNIAKRKRKAGNGEISDAEKKDNEVGLVLEKLVVETMEEFKALMQNDVDMAVAALHLLENHTENLERLVEKDNKVAEIIAKAREMSVEEELLSDDNHYDNVLVNENTLRQKVTNLLKPVGEVVLNEELLNSLPENVRLGMEAMGAVIGNRRGLKAELMDSYNATSHRNCCGFCVISCNFISDRHDMSVAAEAMLVVIKDIIGNKPQDVTRPIRRGEMEVIPTNCVGLGSRNDLLQKIIKALASTDIHALGVFGMGGTGKTTLGREVAMKAIGMFETTVMVEISETPNIEYIQNQIGDGLGLALHHVHGVREKAIRLYTKLKPEEGSQGSKKILIVLDNIWNKIDPVQMGIPREYCKLLLTSREREVCKAMDVPDVNIFEVGLLNEVEAKDLFKFQVQKEVTGEYNSVADRLLEKCGGLPLSIVATANSLKGKELPLWRQFAEELEKPITCQITGARFETFSILRTSYEMMASEEKKKFFSMACLSPIGSSISIDNLMRYGIGLDLFQHVNKLSEAIELADTWAKELVSSSMLLKGDSNEFVKIHDVVRESTMSFASKTAMNTDGQMFLVDAIPRWICEETFNKYIGISLLAQPNFGRLSGVNADLLQILLFRGNGIRNSFCESNFFQGMTNLKVLEMSVMNFEKGLPESLCKLKVLKTLHLVECELGDIKLIGELAGSLLVLSLRGSIITEGLPDEIGKLYKLRLLDLSACQCKDPRIPANVISRLSLLEGLYLGDSNFKEWAGVVTSDDDTVVCDRGGMDELNKLDFLNVLEIRMVSVYSLPICAEFVNNLKKFQIHLGSQYFKRQPLERSLRISDFNVSQLLEKNNCLKALIKEADLLSLKSVTMKNIVPELDDKGLKDLTYLEVASIDSISRICQGTAPKDLFFNLRHFNVLRMDALQDLLPVNPLPHNLTFFTIRDCQSLAYIFTENDASPPPPSNKDDGVVNNDSDIIELPSLKTLKLINNSILTSVVKLSSIDDENQPQQGFFNSKVKLPSLKKLLLYFNARIVKLWGKESNMESFQNLKEINIKACYVMKSLGPLSTISSLVNLEALYITNCSEMQHVMSKDDESESRDDINVTFPKLKFLEIKAKFKVSVEIDCFYNGSCDLQ
ncbi:disease resistance protein At4g27190-like isoform X2 [Silene latifolia]|uniref:disease resistance protein At4g27190-like isoform X2 n=2 Tax=Silene latifolia TaxID=37657 RepID=UPI003D773E91